MKFVVPALVAYCAAAPLALSAEVDAQSTSPRYELSVERISSEVYNPWTQKLDEVEVRAFQGESGEGLVAPVMRVSPGKVLSLRVNNKLQPCSADQIAESKCYNSTNIHTHGLWISPSGNSDNVMLSIDPGERFEYEFVIPPDHPAGTFWYHPHMHGATSIQLGSGMAGALIIDGDRVPTKTSPGDIDILFRDAGGNPFGEQIMVFSQIQYGCFEEGEERPRFNRDIPPWDMPPWECEDGEVGTVDSFRLFNPFPEMASGRLTGVNGKVQPTISGFETGQFQRLRMIHAGLRRPVDMSIRKLAKDAPNLRDVPGSDHIQWINDYCIGDPVEQFHFADDGLTRYSMRRVDSSRLTAGSRYDALAYFEEPGEYCVINNSVWGGNEEQKRILSIFEVSGKPAPVDRVSDLLSETLIAAAAQRIGDERVRDKVVADLKDDFSLFAFAWRKPVRDEELTGKQDATFSIVVHEDGGATLSIDGTPYKHERIDRTLTLGDVEEWEITSNLGLHPFHIHVNPFQIVGIVDDQGRDVTVEGTEAYDPDYAGMLGGWRDTVLVKRNYRITMRTRYRRYVGDFVMHCHFASHGDEGMMQNIRIQTRGDRAASMTRH
ncbi:multicopper oxidase family protein [Qipengyuania psychrotolerans]|uniref:Multicopper oxidase domain-containing protein n=1 Tax=Qipengyuania psychrotolerans TaxID=2867238 RepID=A0ABX8ZCE4_9SPHN|nr:multicopper oxidase domain-containing protein [Qipengyuania psychrotolerans]QZD86665.1 multicopper oxidase domain-containing protein [Qipengyuania psychrotolerans]